ncbi:LysE family transporter [Neisseriaceae bacterium ESL0693]|nr:LysE family transporter [Neisseriaceae bacterium ESL0693]
MLSHTQSIITSIVLLNLLGQLSPGPDVLMISKTALTYSRWAAFKVVLGITTGVAFWLWLTIQGYSTLLQQLPWLQSGFMLGGGAYLIYNGYHMLPKRFISDQYLHIDSPALTTTRFFYYKGLITNLSNPKIVLYLGSVMSAALNDIHNPALKYQIMVILLIQVLITFSLLLWLFSLPWMKKHYLRFNYVIDWIGGIVFICFGLWLYAQVVFYWISAT